MSIRWRYSAISDLAHIRDYITERNPAAGDAVVSRVLQSVENLETFPKYGRLGQVRGTREVVVPGLPYIVVYIDTETDVDVIAVFHASQDRS